MREVTITEEGFREIASDIGAQLAVDIENATNDPLKGIEITLLTALFSARLHAQLFGDDETLEVEE